MSKCDNPETIYEQINCIYKKAGYLDKYGIDVLITSIIIFLVVGFGIYYAILNNLQPLKANWDEERCKPYVLPFASIINKPSDQSSFEYTVNNFNGCVKSIFSDLIGALLIPIYFILNIIITIMTSLSLMLKALLTFLNVMKRMIMNLINSIYERLYAVTIPFIKLSKTLTALNKKTGSVFKIVLYGINTLLYVFRSVVTSLWNAALVSIATVMVIVMQMFWFFPVGWIPATILLAILLVILITLATFSILMSNQMKLAHKSTPLPPKKPDPPCAMWGAKCGEDGSDYKVATDIITKSDVVCCDGGGEWTEKRGGCKKNVFDMWFCAGRRPPGDYPPGEGP